MQKMLSYVRRAVDHYHMIEDGDRIAVGVSGGKDSLALLVALAKLRAFYPKRFEVVAITLEMGLNAQRTSSGAPVVMPPRMPPALLVRGTHAPSRAS